VLIGYYIPDMIVEDLVVVEFKALSGGLDNSHVAQIIGYLAVTGCPVGLLINFGQRSPSGGGSFHLKTSPNTGSTASGSLFPIGSRQSWHSCQRIQGSD